MTVILSINNSVCTIVNLTKNIFIKKIADLVCNFIGWKLQSPLDDILV